jgi:hypothetical protein
MLAHIQCSSGHQTELRFKPGLIDQGRSGLVGQSIALSFRSSAS